MKSIGIIFILLLSLGSFANEKIDIIKSICEVGDCENKVIDNKLFSQGIVGATCSSYPRVYAKVNNKKRRVPCFSAEERFYPGISMLLAKSETIRRCKAANALDPAGNYPDATGSCYHRCKVDVHCNYGDNR